MKRLKLLVSAVVCAVGLATPAMASAESGGAQFLPHDGVCLPLPMHVALGPGQPKNQYVSGTFCYPFTQDRSRSIDILVHGATYDRSYWDSAYQFPSYSYVNRALGAGRAVYYYDRLGVGKSSFLPSTSVTMDADAYVVHQLISKFKPVFPTTNLIGHSYGSRISQLETSQYNDATRLILTDNLHAAGPALVGGLIKQYPANQDPQFMNHQPPYDNGWMTTEPDITVRDNFYYLPGADQNEIVYDNNHKAIVSQTEFTQGQALGKMPAGQNMTNKITRPVLLIAGQEDALYCGLTLDCTQAVNVKNFEQPYYDHAASLDAITIPNTGHDLALHKSAQTSFDAINSWISQH